MTEGQPADLTGRTILVVEDEFYLADDLRQALAERGATVAGPVGTIAKARALIDREALDFAVLDVNLRGEMVFALADELRSRGVPFVFTTGYDAAVLPAKYRDIPRWEKPITAARLVEAIMLA